MSAPIQNTQISDLLTGRVQQTQSKADAIVSGQEFQSILADRLKLSAHAKTRLESREIALDADGHVVAVGISVSHNAETDIRRYLQHRTEQIEAALFVRPTRNLDVHCLRHASDAMALADGVKPLIRDFVSHREAHRVLLFYAGPLSGACFIGHRLNAVCREIQIMEWSNPGYMPSFTLA